MAVSDTVNTDIDVKTIINTPFVYILSISLLSALTVGLALYWVNLFFFRTRWMYMLKEALPRYKHIVYGLGEVYHLDVDQVLLKHDLSASEFFVKQDEVHLNIDGIFKKHHIIKSLGDVKHINVDELVTLKDFDTSVFEQKNGLLTLSIDKLMQQYAIPQSLGDVRQINFDGLLSMHDLDISDFYIDSVSGQMRSLNHLLDNTKVVKGVLTYDNSAAADYKKILALPATQFIQNLMPLVVQVRDEVDLQGLQAFLKKFSGPVIVDFSQSPILPDALDAQVAVRQ